MRILAIGPHPDDVEIGMGGTILALRAQGHDVTVCDLTNGEPTPIGTPERRAREAADAARILGVPRITLEMPNRYLVDTVDNRMRVAEFLPAGERLPVLASDEVAVVPAPRPQVVKEPLVPAFRAKLRRISQHGIELAVEGGP